MTKLKHQITAIKCSLQCGACRNSLLYRLKVKHNHLDAKLSLRQTFNVTLSLLFFHSGGQSVSHSSTHLNTEIQ